MNKKFMIMIIIAIALALGATKIADNWLKSQVMTDTPKEEHVVIAAIDIPFGIKIEPKHVSLIAWPADSMPKNSFNTTESVIGKVTKSTIYAGDLITDKRVAKHLGGSTLSALITKNYRAISVRVNDVVGVSGFILPGNYVDVLSTRMLRNNSSGPRAKIKTLLENIKVLAVDQEAATDKEKPAIVRAVTLELLPQQAEVLVKALVEGKIQLTLRNPLDEEVIVADPVVKIDKPVIQKKVRRRRYIPPAILVLPWHEDKKVRCTGNIC